MRDVSFKSGVRGPHTPRRASDELEHHVARLEGMLKTPLPPGRFQNALVWPVFSLPEKVFASRRVLDVTLVKPTRQLRQAQSFIKRYSARVFGDTRQVR